MSESVRDILIRRDEMTPEEADELLNEMREQVADGFDPEELLYDIGLEPDYIFDLL